MVIYLSAALRSGVGIQKFRLAEEY
jgi:hypothetical protein